jgi:tRNA(fMet)-specific endonuclease VapC
MDRLILDSGALIALERADSPIEALADDADVAIAALTASELLVGVDLADTAHRQQRQEFVEGVLDRVEVIAFDLEIARHHAALMTHVRDQGRPRGAHDLQIAATARATKRALITTDTTAFTDLPEVNYRLVR